MIENIILFLLFISVSVMGYMHETVCKAGYEVDSNQDCVPCKPGMYSDGTSNDCIPCLLGSYQPIPGSSSCIISSPGIMSFPFV